MLLDSFDKHDPMMRAHTGTQLLGHYVKHNPMMLGSSVKHDPMMLVPATQ